MILSDRTIREELAAGRIVIDPLEPKSIQPSSVDLRLDRLFRVFLNHTTPVIDEIFNTFLIPQMFAEVAQGKSTPSEAVSAFARKAQGIYRKWRNQGLV